MYSLATFEYALKNEEQILTFHDILRVLLPSSLRRNDRFQNSIHRVAEEDMFIVLAIEGIRMPLYYPKGLPVEPLLQVVSEIMDVNNPHYYENYGTDVKADIVLDCGAAEGLFGLKIVTECKRLYLAEPLPIYHHSLLRTFKGRNNVELMPFAMGELHGKVNFSVGRGDCEIIASRVVDKPSDLVVEQRTIDELFYEEGRELTYIKADVEGSEIGLIRGGTKTISANKPKIAIATYHAMNHASELIRILRDICPSYEIRTNGFRYDKEKGTIYPFMLHAIAS